MLWFGGFLLRFHLASDWSQNNKHSRNFLWRSRFYGKDYNSNNNIINTTTTNNNNYNNDNDNDSDNDNFNNNNNT